MFIGLDVMTQWHGISRRKRTGGRYRPFRSKRRRELGRDFHPIIVGKEKKSVLRTRGGSRKMALLTAEYANVLNPADKKMKRVKIVAVNENPANPNYVQRNIITKGAIIQTDAGLARVVSRPSQDGVINAILLSK
jgi:small subunit ribosomal protein S8e